MRSAGSVKRTGFPEARANVNIYGISLDHAKRPLPTFISGRIGDDRTLLYEMLVSGGSIQ